MKENFSNQTGLAALLIVIIIAAASLIAARSAVLLGLGELEYGYITQKGAEAFSVADGCLEETLRRLRLNNNYGLDIGSINLILPNGSCLIEVINLGGNQRQIIIASTIGDYSKKIQAVITLFNNVITIDSWEELSS